MLGGLDSVNVGSRRAIGIGGAVLAVAVAIALVVGLLVQRARAAEVAQAAQSASAEAVTAAGTTDFLDALSRVRTVGFESLDAVRSARMRVLDRIRSAASAERARIARQEAARSEVTAADSASSSSSGGDNAEPPARRPSGGLLIGDSVSLGAQSCLAARGYRVDSEVGRQFSTGLDLLRGHAAGGLPRTVVIHLGTNGPFDSSGFASAMQLVSGVDRVVWVTIALPPAARYSFVDSLNSMIRSQAAAYDNVRVADFAAAAARHPEWLAGDGIHIAGAGCDGFTQVVDAAVTRP